MGTCSSIYFVDPPGLPTRPGPGRVAVLVGPGDPGDRREPDRGIERPNRGGDPPSGYRGSRVEPIIRTENNLRPARFDIGPQGQGIEGGRSPGQATPSSGVFVPGGVLAPAHGRNRSSLVGQGIRIVLRGMRTLTEKDMEERTGTLAELVRLHCGIGGRGVGE
jgi:hypothetical protein